VVLTHCTKLVACHGIDDVNYRSEPVYRRFSEPENRLLIADHDNGSASPMGYVSVCLYVTPKRTELVSGARIIREDRHLVLDGGSDTPTGIKTSPRGGGWTCEIFGSH